ncbi:hypothetical protein FA15DRAFT_671483 [Coprinopsis marcescibilis]|uniref:Uncharacterized protein n=1 Tax=Coprinopsis marcescibilis TaxID=230819 RepID=A0A5C3KQ51_COPMA|nr:hypothetical protein FA15DRAFT_671483 [Coprinopsis marcescibilis]
MGYASYGSAQMAKLDNQLTHAVQMVCEWGNHVSAGNPNDAVGGGVGGGSGAVTGLWIGGQFKAGPVEHVMDGVNAGSPGSGNAGASSNGNVDMPVTPLMTAMGGGHEVLGSDYASGARGWNGSAWTGAGVTPGWTGATASQPAHPTGVNGSNRMSISSSVGETTFDPVEHQRQVQLQQHQHQHQHQHQQHQHQQRQQQQQQYSSAPALTMSPWLPAGHNAHQSHPPRREGSSRTRTPTPPIPIHLFDFSLASDKERAFMENRDHHARVYSQGGVPGSATGSPASGTGANTKGPGHGHDHRHSQTTAVMPMGDRTNRLGGGGNGNGRGAASANDRSGGMMSLGMSEMANSLDDILNAPYAAVGGAAHVGPGNSALMGIGMGPAGISGVNALGLNSLSTIGKREREKERAKQKERSNKGQKTTRGRDKKAKEKKKDKERRRERMDAEWVDARRSDYPDVALAIAGRDGLSSSAPVGVYPYSYGAQASGSSHHQRPSTSGGFRQNGTVDESESESEDSEDDDTDADDGQPHSHSQSQLQGRSWFGTGFGTQGSPGHTPALVPSRLQPQPHSEGYAHAPQQQPSMPQIQYQHQLMHQSGSQQLQQHRSHTLPTLPTYMQSQHVPSVPHRASTMPTIGTTVSIPPIPRFPEPTIPPVPPPLPPNEEESDDSDSEDEEADDAEAFIPPLDDFGAPPGAAMQGHQGGHHALHSQQAPSPQAHHPHAHQQQQHYQQGMQYRHPHQHQMYHPYPPSTYPQQQRQT